MITAYRANFIKYSHEQVKKIDTYCVIEIQLPQQNFTQITVINQSGLVLATKAKAITAIKGYRSYTPEKKGVPEFGLGGLIPLSTKDPKGMLEGLAGQMQFSYSIFSQAFGESLLKLAALE